MDFIVLDSRYVGSLPVLSDWIKQGIPDQRAQLIYEAGADVNNRVAIYRWKKPPGVY